MNTAEIIEATAAAVLLLLGIVIVWDLWRMQRRFKRYDKRYDDA